MTATTITPPDKRQHENLTIRSASHGGFIVLPERMGDYMDRIILPLYAGPLGDCLAFIESELSKPSASEQFQGDGAPWGVNARIHAAVRTIDPEAKPTTIAVLWLDNGEYDPLSYILTGDTSLPAMQKLGLALAAFGQRPDMARGGIVVD